MLFYYHLTKKFTYEVTILPNTVESKGCLSDMEKGLSYFL